MAECKLDITKTVKEVCERSLDVFEYKGLTIRQWADKITAGEYQPVKHGKWSKQGLQQDAFGDFRVGFICSACKNFVPIKGKYCAECGARMDGEQE